MLLHDWNLERKMQVVKAAYDALPEGGAYIVIENTQRAPTSPTNSAVIASRLAHSAGAVSTSVAVPLGASHYAKPHSRKQKLERVGIGPRRTRKSCRFCVSMTRRELLRGTRDMGS
jgi:hypothetical protein